jgi:hypothetical protein
MALQRQGFEFPIGGPGVFGESPLAEFFDEPQAVALRQQFPGLLFESLDARLLFRRQGPSLFDRFEAILRQGLQIRGGDGRALE